MSHARPSNKEYDFHRSQLDCIRLNLDGSTERPLFIEQEKPWTWVVLESDELIDSLLADSVRSN